MNEEDMVPIPLRVPMEEFLAKLGKLILECADLPRDGKWRAIQISVEVQTDEDPRPGTGFLLGGSSAG